jgi:hypothetical protein
MRAPAAPAIRTKVEFSEGFRACRRRASLDAADGAVEAVARIIAQIRCRWPQVRILVRADSGFARDELMAWCEANGVHFLFGLADDRPAGRPGDRSGEEGLPERRRMHATSRVCSTTARTSATLRMMS